MVGPPKGTRRAGSVCRTVAEDKVPAPGRPVSAAGSAPPPGVAGPSAYSLFHRSILARKAKDLPDGPSGFARGDAAWTLEGCSFTLYLSGLMSDLAEQESPACVTRRKKDSEVERRLYRRPSADPAGRFEDRVRIER